MRASRAYLAGFGTAGSILAGAAVLFVLGSAIVAFQGWPKIASQGSPAAVQIQGGGPVAGSRVSRRLRAVTTAAPAPGRGVAARRGARMGAAPGGLSVVIHRSGLSGLGSGGGGSAPVRSRSSGTTSSSGSGRGSGDITVSTPTNPPVTVRVPTRTVTGVVKTTGTAVNNVTNTVGTVVRKVSTGGVVRKVTGTVGQLLGGG